MFASRTVGILLFAEGVNPAVKTLIDALSQDTNVIRHVNVLILPSKPSYISAFMIAISRAIDAAMARTSNPRVHPESLATSRVTLYRVAPLLLLKTIRRAAVEILIDLRGMRVSSDEIASVTFGVIQVWRDGIPEDLNFSSAPCEQGRASQVSLVMYRPTASGPKLLYQCSAVPTGRYLATERRRLAGRAISYVMRAVRCQDSGVPVRECDSAKMSRLHPCYVTWLSLRSALHVARARLRRIWVMPDRWFIAYQHNPKRFITNGHLLVQEKLRTLPCTSKRYYADPCVFNWQGRDHVFFEDYEYASRRGVIVWSVLGANGVLTPPQTVLERPYHLSYPFVFEQAGELFMIPETSANLTVELYRAVNFPTQWQLVKALLTGINAVDATLYYDKRRWWMFVNVGEFGSSTNDELFVFCADQLAGPWLAHQRNPVKSDAAGSRPAGRLFVRGDQLIRPAQNCSVTYGGGVNFFAIDRLSASEFSEHWVASVSPDSLKGCDGLHTISASSTLEVIDGRLASL
jgi:hypothetical protein